MSTQSFAIIGAGLAGTLMGVYLARNGHAVTLYERRGDMRKETVTGGRSINLALSTRGLHALKEIGIVDQVMELAIPMRGRMIHEEDGSLAFQRYSVNPGDVLYSVSRQGLNTALMDAVEQHPNVRILFNRKCTGIDLEEGKFQIEESGSGEKTWIHGGVVIGADGAHSVIRNALQKTDRFQYHQDFLEWGYKELSIPPDSGGGFRIEKNALHIWPRRNFMLIALPNKDRSFTCTLFLPFHGPTSFEQLRAPGDVAAFFRRHFPDVVPLMTTLEEDYQRNPISSLAYIRCFPWHHKDRVVLIGDACHAVVPFYGQGMNAAFEDCSILNRWLKDADPDWEKAFKEYETERKPNVDALADLSLANFLEMRDKVSRKSFLIRKRGENMLHRLFPRRFVPLYSMVTFSLIPYAEAVKQARKQERLLEAVGAGILGVLLILILLAIFLKG